MITYADIPALRLQNQRLTAAPLERPAAVVRRLVAVQAQDYYGALWSLGMRMEAARDTDVERAFDRGEMLRTHLLRPTWHFVLPEDIRGLLALTAARVHQVNGTMYRQTGLDSKIFLRSEAAIATALEGGRYLTRNELRIAIDSAGIDPGSGIRLAYLVMHAELEGVICSGPRRGKQFTYALLDERAPTGRTPVPDREAVLVDLARRYFETRGPAAVDDFSRWSGLTKSEAAAGLETVRAEFEPHEMEGRTYWVSPQGQAPAPDPPRAFLLSIYDEYVSSYKDHGPIAAPEVQMEMAGMDNALQAIIVIDGRIAGSWRRIIQKDNVLVEIKPFRPLDESARRLVRVAAERYAEFLGLKLRLE
jgi:hypothetical protein